MSNAESNLKDRLADILSYGKDDPFSKLASTDAQLDEVVEATIEPVEEVVEEPTAEVVEPVKKEASVTDFSVRELLAQPAFREGFIDTFNQRSGEISAAIEKVAFSTAAKAGAGIGGAAGVATGYSDARKAGKGRIRSAASGAVKGVGGAVLGATAAQGAKNFVDKKRGYAKYKVIS